jgi:hypothetical protein
MPIGQLRVTVQIPPRHHQMPGDHRGLGPQQLRQLILDVLVELIDRGIRLDDQLLLALLRATERGTLTTVEAP